MQAGCYKKMSQEIIIKLFKRHPKQWFTFSDLTKRLKLAPSSITKNLIGLRNSNFVNTKLINVYQNGHRKCYAYQIK